MGRKFLSALGSTLEANFSKIEQTSDAVTLFVCFVNAWNQTVLTFNNKVSSKQKRWNKSTI